MALGLVFAVTIFCGYVLTLYVLAIPQAEIRYAENTQAPDAGALVHGVRSSVDQSLSRLSLLPWRNTKKVLTGVMIENHEDARPHQRGLADALLIEEFFVEGYISRFIALYDSSELPDQVGPVRSLRSYFLDGTLPWTSIFFHIGGSPEALDRTETSETITAFNGVYRDTYFMRKDGIPAPHDAFLTQESFQKLLSEVTEATEVHWPPYKTGRAQAGSGASTISINFFSPKYNVEYLYDPWKQKYIRTNGGILSEATPRNVLILETSVEEVGPYGRLAVGVQGEGSALLFRSGRVYPAAWSKTGVNDPYVFTDENEKPLVFASGQTWMTTVDSMDRIDWEQ